MDGMTTKATVTNQRVADDLGITHSMVSRIRSGDRIPSLDVMLKIHEWGWGLEKQALAKTLGTYAADFEALLVTHYAE